MKILIVDDSEETRKIVRLTVEMKGHEVVEAVNGQAGLEMAAAHMPDLIISDVLMPVMDGFQFLRKIKTEPSLSSIPFIFYSGVFQSDRDFELASSLGAEAYLLKPKTPKELLAEIERIIKKAGKEKPAVKTAIERDEEYLRHYSSVVAAKLEEKVKELEENLDLRKNAEDEIRKQKEFLSKVMESLTHPFYVINADDYTIVISNAAARKAVGSEKNTCYAVAHRSEHPCDAFEHPCPLQIVKKTGKPVTVEHIHYNRDGTARHMEVHGYPVFDNNGKVIQMIEYSLDITERKAAEAARRLNEERLGALFNLSQMRTKTEDELTAFALEEAVRLTKSHGGYLHFFNEDEQTIQLQIWSKEALNICTNVKDLHYPLNRAGIWADCVRQRKPVIHNNYQNLPDKKGYPEGHFHIKCHMSVPIVDDDRIVGVAGVGNKDGTYDEYDVLQLNLFMNSMWGIIKQRRAEEKQRKSAEEIADLYNNAPCGYHSLDKDGIFVRINDTELSWLGYSREEIINKKKFADIISPDSIKSFGERMPELLKRGKMEDLEFEMIRKDGSIMPVLINSIAIKDENGSFLISRSTVYDITERRKATDRIQKQLNRMAALRAIDMTITASLDLQVTLGVFIENVIAQLNVDAVTLLIENPRVHILEYAAGRGFMTGAAAYSHVRIGQGYAGHVALTRKPLAVPGISEHEGLQPPPFIKAEGFKAYFGIPLLAKGRVVGVLELFHRSVLRPDKEWFDFLESLARQAAVAIENAGMFDELQRSHDELIMAYDTTLEGWSRALDFRDKETEGHSKRVTEMSVRIARLMNISEEEIVNIRRGALLHDIGKLGVPDGILLKPGKLTEEEWALMKKHPRIAYELLSPISFLRSALDIPYCHHEKWDGSGYPRGLKGEEIPFPARIFAVVDIFDALLSDRPYRPAWPLEKVREYILSLSGTELDPGVVEVFMKIRQW